MGRHSRGAPDSSPPPPPEPPARHPYAPRSAEDTGAWDHSTYRVVDVGAPDAFPLGGSHPVSQPPGPNRAQPAREPFSGRTALRSVPEGRTPEPSRYGATRADLAGMTDLRYGATRDPDAPRYGGDPDGPRYGAANAPRDGVTGDASRYGSATRDPDAPRNGATGDASRYGGDQNASRYGSATPDTHFSSGTPDAARSGTPAPDARSGTAAPDARFGTPAPDARFGGAAPDASRYGATRADLVDPADAPRYGATRADLAQSVGATALAPRREQESDPDEVTDTGARRARSTFHLAPEADETEEHDYDDEPSLLLQWGIFVAQTLTGAVAGVGVWLGFYRLWSTYPLYAAPAVGLVTILMLVLARTLRRRHGHDLDLMTASVTIGIATVLTVLPAAFTLQNLA